jgi:calcineurin-like phosphoesterase family protein
MPEVFFIGDTHFGHKNILKYEPDARQYKEFSSSRPFKDIDEHDEYLVSEWNKVVSPLDIVFHLGDFCMGKKSIEIASCLNGRKRLILGNHDVYPASEYLKYFEKLHGALFYKNYLLSHIPVHPNHARAIVNIHGHLHSHYVCKVSPNLVYVNVSCEQTSMRPISMDEVNLRIYGMMDKNI